jgi:hypothetical protein
VELVPGLVEQPAEIPEQFAVGVERDQRARQQRCIGIGGGAGFGVGHGRSA